MVWLFRDTSDWLICAEYSKHSVIEHEEQDKMVRAAFLNQIRRRAEREKKSGSRGGLKNQKKSKS